MFPLGSLLIKRQLCMEWFITAVSGMDWTTLLRKITISLSLICTYHPVLYELDQLSCYQRGQAEEWQSQDGRSKTRRVALTWSGDQRDLYTWLHDGPTDRCVSESRHLKNAPQWHKGKGKQVNIKSRRDIDGPLSSALFEHTFQGLQM